MDVCGIHIRRRTVHYHCVFAEGSRSVDLIVRHPYRFHSEPVDRAAALVTVDDQQWGRARDLVRLAGHHGPHECEDNDNHHHGNDG